jgi:hypothetical protein
MSETTVYTDFRLHASHLAETGERSLAETAVRRDLAAAYQLCALFGWDDLVYTHISARVPGPLDAGIEWPALLRRLERAAGPAFAR